MKPTVTLLAVLCVMMASLSTEADVGRRRPITKDLPILKNKLPALTFEAPHLKELLGRSGELGNANDYMDEVMYLVRKEIIEQGYDILPLPDGDFSFSWDLYPGVQGGVFFTEGFMKGMETLVRVGDATLSSQDTTIYFESLCGINNAAMGYNLLIEFLDIGPSGSMTGTIGYAHFNFKAVIDIPTGIVMVETLDIQDIGKIHTDITGLGPFNWLAEMIADFAINLLSGFLKEFLEGPLTNLMNKVIQDYIDSLQNNGFKVLGLVA